MPGYEKVFRGMLGSSVWGESSDTRVVWMTLILSCDQQGIVEASVGGLARLANVSREAALAAIERLSSPDEDSRTPDLEGRRIEAVSGGWRIVNYLQYREKAQDKEGSRAPYMRQRRAERVAEEGNSLQGDETSASDVDVDVDVDGKNNGAVEGNSTKVEPPPSHENYTQDNYHEPILAEFYRRSGIERPNVEPRTVFDLIDSWRKQNVPFRIVARGITDCFQKNGKKPRSFLYVRPAVEEAIDRWVKARP